MPSRPPLVRPVSRRALLGTAVGVGVLSAAGCSSLDPTPGDPTITPTSTPSGAASAPGPGAGTDGPGGETDDGALVDEVLVALAVAHRTARANARLHPGVASTLRPFEDLHRTHARELGDLPRTTGRVADPAESPAQVVARLARVEGRLQRTLVDAATSAGSGALAQTLASMAAGVAQLRTTL